MKFIDGLDQKEANTDMLQAHNYYTSDTAASFLPSTSKVPYSFQNTLSVSDLENEQSTVLLLCHSFSCNLLTTLYLYSTQFCLIGLLLLLIASLALVALCLLLCLHSYHQCFDLKTTTKGGGRKKGEGGNHSLSPSDGCLQCQGQRDIIIQVNQALPVQQPPAPAPLPPKQKSPPKASPPKSAISQPNSEVNQHLADDHLEEATKAVEESDHHQQPEEGNHQQEPEPSAVSVEPSVSSTSAAEPKNKSAAQDSIEVLAMHLATHLSSVQSLLESSDRKMARSGRRRGGGSKKSSSSSSQGSLSTGSTGSGSDKSIYLSDLPPLSSLAGTSTSNSTSSSSTSGGSKKAKRMKRQQQLRQRKRRSILCFPLSANQSTLPAALFSKDQQALAASATTEDEYQTADEEEEVAAEMAALLLLQQPAPPPPPAIPLPSCQVPPCMVLNRYAHQLLPPEEGEEEEEQAVSSSESL